MKILKIILRSFIPNTKVAWIDYKNAGAKIPFKIKINDLLAVLRNTGFFMLFIAVAVILMLLVSPGRDALLLVIEDVNNYEFSSLISLIAGVFFWSIISEFGVRYSIYVTDNSGKNLRAERVDWRKFVQKLVAGGCLMFPCILVIISLITLAITDPSIRENKMWVSLCFTIFLVYWELSILTNLYFHSYYAYKHGIKKKQWLLDTTRLSAPEVYWTSKIYGIYNEYVFSLPKPANYLGKELENIKPFTDFFEKAPKERRNAFPQNERLLVDGTVVPEEFEFRKFEDGGDDKNEMFRWMYRIPLSFYRVLHRQVVCVFVASAVFLLTMSFLPADRGIFEFLGSPGLLCGSLACWIGIYVGVLYTDFALLRDYWFSVRLFLVLLLLFSSYVNNDHPVRVYPEKNTTRMALNDHFDAWFTNYKKLFKNKSDTDKYPVVFICAEGGAFRTGAYTALFLEELEQKLAQRNVNFKRSVYAMSGVSGGALGLGFYNTENYINKPGDFIKQDGSSPAELFFRHDCLAPIMGKMMYGDLLNLWIPFHIDRFDRAIALESSWENAFGQLLQPARKKSGNTFKKNFLSFYPENAANPRPLFLINTTEAETGYSCWLSSAQPDYIAFGDERDLYRKKFTGLGMSYSTAINISSRFPLFSPGGMVEIKEKTKSGKDTSYRRHYVDGGYYENTGAGGMYELMSQLRRDSLSKHIYPIVIYLRFSGQPANQVSGIRFGNEITEIMDALFDTRAAHTHIAVQQLNGLTTFFNSHGNYQVQTGTWIDEPLKQNLRQVPMNWVLSKQSMDNVKSAVKQQLEYNGGIMRKIINCQYPFPQIKSTASRDSTTHPLHPQKNAG